MTEKKRNEATAAIAAIMKTIGSVEKGGFNKFHGYNYTTASDVAFALQKTMGEHGLVIAQDELEKKLICDNAMWDVTYEFCVMHESGDELPTKRPPRVSGLASAGNQNDKKGFVWDDKAINKASTAAEKYFTLRLFKIPTGDYPDADADGDVPSNPNRTMKKQAAPSKAQNPAGNPEFSIITWDGEVREYPSYGPYLQEIGNILKACKTEAETATFAENNFPAFDAHVKTVHALAKGDPNHQGYAAAKTAFDTMYEIFHPYTIPPKG